MVLRYEFYILEVRRRMNQMVRNVDRQSMISACHTDMRKQAELDVNSCMLLCRI